MNSTGETNNKQNIFRRLVEKIEVTFFPESERKKRVKEIKKSIASGEYKIDNKKVAKAIDNEFSWD